MSKIKKITQEEFLSQYAGAPFDIFELASITQNIKDNKDLSDTSKRILIEYENFIYELENIGFEFG